MTTAWITDGSAVTFLDTHKLNVTVPSNAIFKKGYYEGLTDQNVFIRSGSIGWQEGGHDAELEWVLIFDRPITEMTFTDKTECTLQGMIEGKNLAQLLGEGEIPWAPASIGNNVIATMDDTGQEIVGGVEKITLQDLQRDDILATMRLNFKKEDGGTIPTREVPSTVLKDLPVVELLEALKKSADEYGLTDCRVVNLGANGKHSAYVNNTFLKLEAVLEEISSRDGILAILRTGFEGVRDKVRNELIKELIEEEKGIGKGCEAHLQVFDHSGGVVGEAVLKAV